MISQLVAHSVATYAISLRGFPKRTGIKALGAYEEKAKYHGHKLVM